MDRIIEILKEINPYIDVDSGTQLLEDGVLDSMGIMFLVASIEDAYDIEIPGEEIIPENFDNIDSIEKLIRRFKKCK